MLFLVEMIFRTFEGNTVTKGIVTEQVRYRLIELNHTEVQALDRIKIIEKIERTKHTDGKYHWDENITANEYEVEIHSCL